MFSDLSCRMLVAASGSGSSCCPEFIPKTEALIFFSLPPAAAAGGAINNTSRADTELS